MLKFFSSQNLQMYYSESQIIMGGKNLFDFKIPFYI